MTHITVEHIHTDLHKEEWTFYFFDREMQLVLSYYKELERATKRHKFVTKRSYNRYDHNKRDSNMTVDEVILPGHVTRDAIEQFMNKLTIVKKA